MKYLKKFIMLLALADNFLVNLPKQYIFKNKWILAGKCRQCGNCCREILLKMTPRQISSNFFTNLTIKWITWLFDFILLEIDREHHYLVFTCKHLKANGKCGNYFWRPGVCRNFPLVDYFEKPKLLPECGFVAKPRHN